MQIPNFNTIAMGILFTLFVALGLNFLSELVFHAEKPAVSGYKIEVAETTSGSGAAEAEAEPDIATLMASADAGAGEKTAKRCVACHSFDEGGANKVGPALWDIVNRNMGTAAGFKYSGSLTGYGTGKKWTYEELNGFLKKPSNWINGTSMSFAGLKKPADRANVIAYLRSKSGSPAPLPGQ